LCRCAYACACDRDETRLRMTQLDHDDSAVRSFCRVWKLVAATGRCRSFAEQRIRDVQGSARGLDRNRVIAIDKA